MVWVAKRVPSQCTGALAYARLTRGISLLLRVTFCSEGSALMHLMDAGLNLLCCICCELWKDITLRIFF